MHFHINHTHDRFVLATTPASISQYPPPPRVPHSADAAACDEASTRAPDQSTTTTRTPTSGAGGARHRTDRKDRNDGIYSISLSHTQRPPRPESLQYPEADRGFASSRQARDANERMSCHRHFVRFGSTPPHSTSAAAAKKRLIWALHMEVASPVAGRRGMDQVADRRSPSAVVAASEASPWAVPRRRAVRGGACPDACPGACPDAYPDAYPEGACPSEACPDACPAAACPSEACLPAAPAAASQAVPQWAAPASAGTLRRAARAACRAARSGTRTSTR